MEGEYSGNCNFEGSNSKKKKINLGTDNLLQITSDRISDLPESLLIQILSLLDTKDAFKTGLLSKRWKNVWTYVENIEFDYVTDEPCLEHLKRFISFVDHTLLHCTSPNLKKFSLIAGSYYDDESFADDVIDNVIDKCLQFILKKNVECLKFITSSHAYRAPEWFYHKSSFVQLEIHDWEIKILEQAVSWPSLKILVLAFVKIDDEQMAKILLGCPVLEELTLDQTTDVTHLNIVSPSVRKLIVSQSRESAYLLNLNAHWLQELGISVFSSSFIPRLISVSSLTTAKIKLKQGMQNYFDDEDHEDLVLNMACQLLESIQHTKELTLAHFFIQALSITKHIGRPSPLFMCKHLTVHLSTFKYDFPGIVCLLQSSPNLENLVIEVDSCSDVCCFPNIFAGLHDMDISSIPPSGNSMRLKNVKIIHSKRLCYRETLKSNEESFPEIALTEYLFNNEPFMGKLVISAQTKNCKKCATNCASYYIALVSSNFFRVCAERDDSSDWQVTKNGSTLQISLI